jgi:excisionase family DNA binding protein
MEKLLVSVQEAAEALGIGQCAVYDLIRTNRLRSVKIGSRRLVPVDALAETVALLVEESG